MSCEVKRIQQNSAQQAADQAALALKQAQQAYITCQGPAEIGRAALAEANDAMTRSVHEAEQLVAMDEILVKQLRKQESAAGTLTGAKDVIGDEAARLQSTLDDLKTQIRTQRRRFLDLGPQTPTSVAGVYFTQETDNQVLIAFLSCYGAFLLFVGLIVGLNQVPVYYFTAMTDSERWRIVLIFWGVSIGLALIGLWVGT